MMVCNGRPQGSPLRGLERGEVGHVMVCSGRPQGSPLRGLERGEVGRAIVYNGRPQGSPLRGFGTRGGWSDDGVQRATTRVAPTGFGTRGGWSRNGVQRTTTRVAPTGIGARGGWSDDGVNGRPQGSPLRGLERGEVGRLCFVLWSRRVAVRIRQVFGY